MNAETETRDFNDVEIAFDNGYNDAFYAPGMPRNVTSYSDAALMFYRSGFNQGRKDGMN